LIVDDEEHGRSVLRKLLAQFCPQVKVCGEAGDITQAYEAVITLRPQVVFLDINMPGDNGFSLLKKFREVPFEVVFVTSYDKYGIEAIKFSALDYLLKPIEVEELALTVNKLSKILMQKKTRQLQLVNVIDHIENPGIEKKIVAHHNDKVLLLSLSDVVYMEGEGNYTMIHTARKEKYSSSKNLGEFEDMLSPYRNFLRVSKSALVNLNHVSAYTKGGPCMLSLADIYTVEISRRKKQEVLERLKEEQQK